MCTKLELLLSAWHLKKKLSVVLAASEPSKVQDDIKDEKDHKSEVKKLELDISLSRKDAAIATMKAAYTGIPESIRVRGVLLSANAQCDAFAVAKWWSAYRQRWRSSFLVQQQAKLLSKIVAQLSPQLGVW